ncbi:MAG: hypothetical protein ACYTFV_06785 [Planctomycetota bacterium]|jgi:hypothetical protein
MRALLNLALLAALASCVPQAPAGPPVVLITVAGVGSPGVLRAMDDGRVIPITADETRSGWDLLAALQLGDEPPAPDPSGFQRIPGERTTLLEVFTTAGLETAAFLEGPGQTEESGLFQGAFHTLDGPTLALAAEDDAEVMATEEALDFVAGKLPRPNEDAPCVWLHLEHGELALEEAQARFGDVWSRTLDLLGDRPDALIVALALPTETLPAAAVFFGAGTLPSRGGIPMGLVDLTSTIAGLAGLEHEFPAGEDRSEELSR